MIINLQFLLLSVHLLLGLASGCLQTDLHTRFIVIVSPELQAFCGTCVRHEVPTHVVNCPTLCSCLFSLPYNLPSTLFLMYVLSQ